MGSPGAAGQQEFGSTSFASLARQARIEEPFSRALFSAQFGHSGLGSGEEEETRNAEAARPGPPSVVELCALPVSGGSYRCPEGKAKRRFRPWLGHEPRRRLLSTNRLLRPFRAAEAASLRGGERASERHQVRARRQSPRRSLPRAPPPPQRGSWTRPRARASPPPAPGASREIGR